MHATVYISTGCGACLLLYLSGVVWPCVSICKPWLSPLQPWQLVDTLSRVCKAPHEGGVFCFFKTAWMMSQSRKRISSQRERQRKRNRRRVTEEVAGDSNSWLNGCDESPGRCFTGQWQRPEHCSTFTPGRTMKANVSRQPEQIKSTTQQDINT